MQCWICKRPARGFGHANLQFSPEDPGRFVLDWVFCSRRCQDIFHAFYGQCRQRTRPEIAMQRTAIEQAARKDCLKAFGAAAERIGFETPLGNYSEEQALAVIDAIVSRYTEAMADHHARTAHPPVRGMPVADDPFIDDDIPF